MRNYRESLQNFAERQTTNPFQLYRTEASGRERRVGAGRDVLRWQHAMLSRQADNGPTDRRRN